jgi:NADH dehydrogenase FAD-containing subunit
MSSSFARDAPGSAHAPEGALRQHASALEELAACVKRDLALLNYPQREWLTPRSTHEGAPILDVLIVGAGQGGLATAFGLSASASKTCSSSMKTQRDWRARGCALRACAPCAHPNI